MATLAFPDSATYPYQTPTLPQILTISSYLYLLNISGKLAEHLLNADLLGQIFIGIIFGPPLANILPAAWLQTFACLGYVGLILLVFHGGLTTDLSLILPNLGLSFVVAATGVILPIALSVAYIPYALGYSVLQGFAAGAALASTSLGTTLAVLSTHKASITSSTHPEKHNEVSAIPVDGDIRRTRVATVLMTAAMADDVVGLVLAALIPALASGNAFAWQSIVRPVLVSLAFVSAVPLFATFLVNPSLRWLHSRDYTWLRNNSSYREIHGIVSRHALYTIVMVVVLSASVSGAHYAGTSELLGAYVAGCWLASIGPIFSAPIIPPTMPHAPSVTAHTEAQASSSTTTSPTYPPPLSQTSQTPEEPFASAFSSTLSPVLDNILAPLFFGSIGASVPFLALWRPARVIWQGAVYALLMALAKFGAAGWWLLWQHPGGTTNRGPFSRRGTTLFLGTALVARGEIALIVAALARPLLEQVPPGKHASRLGGTQEELYSVVMWAALACTLAGAMGVGAIIRRNNVLQP